MWETDHGERKIYKHFSLFPMLRTPKIGGGAVRHTVLWHVVEAREGAAGCQNNSLRLLFSRSEMQMHFLTSVCFCGTAAAPHSSWEIWGHMLLCTRLSLHNLQRLWLCFRFETTISWTYVCTSGQIYSVGYEVIVWWSPTVCAEEHSGKASGHHEWTTNLRIAGELFIAHDCWTLCFLFLLMFFVELFPVTLDTEYFLKWFIVRFEFRSRTEFKRRRFSIQSIEWTSQRGRVNCEHNIPTVAPTFTACCFYMLSWLANRELAVCTPYTCTLCSVVERGGKGSDVLVKIFTSIQLEYFGGRFISEVKLTSSLQPLLKTPYENFWKFSKQGETAGVYRKIPRTRPWSSLALIVTSQRRLWWPQWLTKVLPHSGWLFFSAVRLCR